MALPQPPFGSAIQGIVFGGATKVVAVWQNWLQLVQNYIFGLTNSGPTAARPTKDLWVGQPFFDTTINVPVYWNGSTWVTSAPAGTVTGVTGTAPISSSGGTTPDISIAQSNSSTNGYLSSTDWTTFNGKVTSVSGTSPVVSSGGSTPTISMAQSSASANGWLSSADWITFNSKQPAGSYVTTVTGTSPVVSSGGTTPAISMAAANSTTSGYLTSTDWNTFNNAATYINVKSYGAYDDGTHVVETTTAIQNAINANPYRTLYFPPGRYLVSSLTIPTGTNFIGDNLRYAAIVADSLTGDVVTVTSTSGITILNIVFTANAQRTSGSYLKIAPTSGINGLSRITNCQFIGSYIGIDFERADTWVVSGCNWNNYNVAIKVQNLTNIDAGDSAITSCIFASSIGGISISQYSSGGLKIIGNKFLDATYHYLGQYVTGAGNPSTSILVVSGNSLEAASASSIALNTNSNSFSQVNITGNQFSVPSGGKAIETVGTQLGFVMIGSNEAYIAGSGQFASIGGGSGITFGTNSINGTSSAIGIGLYNSAEVFVTPQSFNASFVNRFVATTANTKFCVGQWRAGSGAYYGPWSGYGSVYISGGINITFSQVFPAGPNISVEISNPPSSSAGGVGYLIQNKSSSGFTLYIITASNAGYVNYEWSAHVSGQ